MQDTPSPRPQRPTRRRVLHSLGAAALLGAAGVRAQDGKPIRVIVPYTPGGVSDTVTRLVVQRMGELLKNTVIVENMGGANGQVGSAAAARAAPDGHTLLAVVAAHAINPSLYAKMAYSPLDDLRGVSQIGHIPLLLVSSAALPPTTLREFVAWAKANPTRANFASSGAGSGAHLAAELLAQTAGIAMTHVPYKGMAPALPDLFSGQVALAYDSVQTMMPHVQAGKLRALAMTSAQRWPAAPEVPTIAEAGYPSLTGGSWIGLLAPAKTPREVLARLSAAAQQAVATPELRDKLVGYGIDPVGGTAEQFDAFIRSEAQRWGDVVRKANIHLD
ncbi:tripartite tricarboxylate transporter substrate binding protein [Pseudorhodoferax sp.]|uniref:tripartite tricarboxylate transporter substrate binding protein n=1 Tax=Pseudorhodoferax sp. TaxID=1993553 RepID=UPI002DD65DB6|nr:tripartite tricarboxylate transporter substrate binding protein [Pseudorhodoferax sp.]